MDGYSCSACTGNTFKPSPGNDTACGELVSKRIFRKAQDKDVNRIIYTISQYLTFFLQLHSASPDILRTEIHVPLALETRSRCHLETLQPVKQRVMV